MSLTLFIQSLLESGEARVPLVEPGEDFGGDEAGPCLVPQEERGSAIELLVRYEPVVRADWPLDAPTLDVGIAVQAAGYLYQASRLILSRHVPEEIVTQVLTHDRIAANGPSAHYSVDLMGRYLPDLFRLAGGGQSEDPLVACLSGFAGRWPLSSVGVPGVSPEQDRLDAVLGDRSLRAAYLDRVLERKDSERLGEARVCAEARLLIGEHRSLVAASLVPAVWPPAEPETDRVQTEKETS